MFSEAELTLTLTALPTADDLATVVGRAVELGMVVTGAGPDANVSGRYAVSVTTGPGRKAAEVQRVFDQLMTTAERLDG
jgi:mannose/fructose/N-acetylgalactosamine-specific phosphotransferase system component IID